MKNPKIIDSKVVLIGTQPPTIGGISTHIHSLKNRLEQNNYTVTVIDVITGKKREEALNGKNPFYLLFNIFFLVYKGYGIFHFHSSRRAYPFLLSIFLLKLLKKKVILSLHHGDFNDWLKKYSLRKNIYVRLFLLSDQIIFMNQKDAEEFKKLSSASDMKVLAISPFIVEDETYYNEVYPVKNEGPFKVSTMGAWRSYYAYEEVIKACRCLSEQYAIEIELDIVAGRILMDRKYRDKITKVVQSENTDQLHLSIFEDKKDILNYLAGRDVLVRSSEIDSYGMCVAEALLVGTPAIATQVCHRPDKAMLYEPDDIEALVMLIKSVYNKRQNQKTKEPLITENDDSFYLIERTYQKLAK